MSSSTEEQIREAHEAAELAGISWYIDPLTGYKVLTRSFLLSRGRCCGSGCRHCPYER